MSVYTAEETGDGVWSIIDFNIGGTGARVLDLQSKEAAEFYTEMMNLVYDRVMKDVREITK
jgi:hypothetical protein